MGSFRRGGQRRIAPFGKDSEMNSRRIFVATVSNGFAVIGVNVELLECGLRLLRGQGVRWQGGLQFSIQRCEHLQILPTREVEVKGPPGEFQISRRSLNEHRIIKIVPYSLQMS